MRALTLTALAVASVLTCPRAEADYTGNVGPGAILLWPTARSTALAGAMTALADEADAAFFNPAGLAFQATAKADLSYGNWLPGLYPGMYHAYIAGGAPLRLAFLHGRNAYLAGSLIYMIDGETDVVDEHGNFLRREPVWRGTAAVHASVVLTPNLAAGVGLKVLREAHIDWNWDWSWYNKGSAAAADLGLLYRPGSRVSIGISVDNLGPPIVYRPEGETDDLPRMARLGLCWTAVESRDVRLRVMPELDKLLVGMFHDTTGTKSFGRMLDEEWRDVWKAVGIEATTFGLVSLRLGYFEDLTNQLGGFVLENEDYQTYHYGLWDALSRRGLGQLKSIGLCWGLGFGTNTLRFDLSSDAAIYDFPTSNWKLQLTCNDIGWLFGRRS
jgi:hypothetical protein